MLTLCLQKQDVSYDQSYLQMVPHTLVSEEIQQFSFLSMEPASLNLILVWRVYLILLDIKPRVPVGSMIKNALVLINLSSNNAGGRSRCLSWRWKRGGE